MARLYSLFSSSRGNATFLGTNQGGILIDAGVSYRRLCAAMSRCGLSMDAVQAVFVTHDHSDHISGLKMLTAKHAIPIYAQTKTLAHLQSMEAVAPNAELREINGEICFADMCISAFDTPHDTVQSCGYRVVMADGRICAVCTDLGEVTPTVDAALRGCDLVLLESNYDEKMLKTGAYPPYLKARIQSKVGHLSNANCAAQAKKLIEQGTTRLLLGHLSQENNRPELAEQSVVSALTECVRGQDYLLQVAKVETTGEMSVF